MDISYLAGPPNIFGNFDDLRLLLVTSKTLTWDSIHGSRDPVLNRSLPPPVGSSAMHRFILMHHHLR